MSLFTDLKTDYKANPHNLKGKYIACFYRIAHYFKRHRFLLIRIIGLPVVKIYEFSVMWVLGVEIHPRTRIGAGLRVPHGYVIVNPDTVIGKNVMIRQFTTIGNKGVPPWDSPVIGDNVEIGANSALIGKITVGDNVIVGAGTILTKSVPANSVVYGNPIKIRTSAPQDGNDVVLEMVT